MVGKLKSNLDISGEAELSPPPLPCEIVTVGRDEERATGLAAGVGVAEIV